MPPRQAKDTSSSAKNSASAPVAETPVAKSPETTTATAESTPAPTTSRRKGKQSAPVAETPVATPAQQTVAEVAVPDVVTSSDAPAEEEQSRAPRVAPTRESVMAEFSELLSILETEVSRLRELGDKSSASFSRFLRNNVHKRLRALHASTARVLKHKTPSARKNNNSGFLKPVNISADIAKFTKLDPKQQHSRVDVTKYLCKYISENNLQNPKDRRLINADPALCKLLGYDGKDEKPLTYYHMQSLLKNHFTKTQ
jgi:chromatin remodeling complex protein RSC6